MTTKRKADEDDLLEFEEQLKQEAAEMQATSAVVKDNVDPDETLYEYDAVRKAWFPKINEDFIANYQMKYGCDVAQALLSKDTVAIDTTVATEATVATADDSFWTNRPEDINSPEYSAWYAQYCQYYNYYAQSDNVGKQEGDTSQTIEETRSWSSSDVLLTKNDADVSSQESKKADSTAPKVPEVPAWFEVNEDKNPNVYVTGLPADITEEEFTELMTKVGLVALDPILRKPKLKLYKNSDGSYKGDGRCCYIKSESVALALQIIDGTNIRGHLVSVERAKFEMKGGQYDPAKKKRKLTNKEKSKFKEKQALLFSWNADDKTVDTRPHFEKVVVIKRMFVPHDFEKDPSLLIEISADLRQECAKFGDVRKVIVYDRHPEGVATVTFRNPAEADLCIKETSGRWFDKRQLEAAHWDGKTKYVVEETEEEMNARLHGWHSFLEATEKNDDKAVIQPTVIDVAVDETHVSI